MIVCHCSVVSHRDVLESMANGAGTLAQICTDSGAGRVCGGCVPALRELLCQHGAITPEAEVEASHAAG